MSADFNVVRKGYYYSFWKPKKKKMVGEIGLISLFKKCMCCKLPVVSAKILTLDFHVFGTRAPACCISEALRSCHSIHVGELELENIFHFFMGCSRVISILLFSHFHVTFKLLLRRLEVRADS